MALHNKETWGLISSTGLNSDKTKGVRIRVVRIKLTP